ncbi:MAG: hypothetical protein A2231_11315 [Candidatus Firestonebacteria bacterium RIFOXYA2_FULL_40_8]|nr:MAG: hypothetical protein A2231_11315 [Candidatus Firestonebacteria bacterium RIFOXYA2_FULL_40_8]
MNNSLVVVFKSHKEADEGLKELQKSGFDMKKLSVIGKDHYAKTGVSAHYVVNEKPKFFGSQFWNSLPYDKGLFVVPGSGPFGVGGPMVALIDESLENSEDGEGKEETINIFDKALNNIGIPKEKIPEYQTYLAEEKYLLIVHGAPEDIKEADRVITKYNPLSTVTYEY